MAHFAEIDENNIVLRVIVVADEHEADGENWCNGFLGGTWKQTSFNTVGNVHALGGTPFRKNYAATGMTYDASRNAFLNSQPFAFLFLSNAFHTLLSGSTTTWLFLLFNLELIIHET